MVIVGYTTERVESGSQGAAVLVGEATVQAVALKLELFVGSSLNNIANCKLRPSLHQRPLW